MPRPHPPTSTKLHPPLAFPDLPKLTAAGEGTFGRKQGEVVREDTHPRHQHCLWALPALAFPPPEEREGDGKGAGLGKRRGRTSALLTRQSGLRRPRLRTGRRWGPRQRSGWRRPTPGAPARPPAARVRPGDAGGRPFSLVAPAAVAALPPAEAPGPGGRRRAPPRSPRGGWVRSVYLVLPSRGF